MLVKQCFKCGRSRPADEFYRHPEMRDGRLNKCRDCTRRDVRENRRRRLDYYRSRDRARGNRQTIEDRRRYRAENPDKYRAHNAVNNALRDGRLAKPSRCESCGRERPLHGHHEDYARPLDVQWLCVPCHADEHRANGAHLNELPQAVNRPPR